MYPKCNNMRRVIITFCMALISQFCFGQISDRVASAIKCLLLDKNVCEKIFFYYKDEWTGPGQLPNGNYAFICPDTTYQSVHKGILALFPSIPDGYLEKVKFYKDSVRSIYVDGGGGPELEIVFKKILAKEGVAQISFFTTSLWSQDRFRDRYVEAEGYLRYINGRWTLEKCKVRPIEWINYFGWRSRK
jgi:hypothetical protein